jgi:hypothetical protein
MTLKRTRRRNMLFIPLGILAVLILGYVIVAVFLKDSKQTEDFLVVSENQAESEVEDFLAGSENQAESEVKDFLAGSENQAESEVKMVTVPFKAEFAAHYTATHEDVDRCGKLPWIRHIVDGTGTEPNLGEFTVHMDFCSFSGTGIYSDVVDSYFVFEVDSLFINTWGKTGPPDENDPPYYTNKWNDPFEFTGGTGRFEGASGGGMTHCYNSTEDDLSHHNWEGTLTMKAE